MTKHDATAATEWWRHGIVYQVYLRSFADGNGDGTGDVAGLRNKLGYLNELGVDALWINPWYSSPLKDGGYDVSDYRSIDERFGTIEEVELFIAEAHDLGIKIIADLVPNHTSDQHCWFQEALAAAPSHPARDRYIFRPGKGPDGSEPPTNWTAVFGGSAWERVADGEWYLHIFDTSQPDLNWQHDDVRAEFDDIFRFWLDRGIDGFRIDVAHGLVKDLSFPDVAESAVILESERSTDHPFWDRDGVHEIIRRWRSVLDEYDNRMMVAEAWVAADRLPLYLRPDEYHQSFNFDLLTTDWDASQFTEVIKSSVEAANSVNAPSTWVLSNHDVMRHATRYGLPAGTKWRKWPVIGPYEALDQIKGTRRARAAALISLSLPGSTYIYQGEELGLPEVWDLPEDILDDPTWERSGHTEKGRDGCRVPLPWEIDGPSFGFGSGAPWMPQPASFGSLSVAAQVEDTNSMLSLYRRAIRLRRDHLAHLEDFSLVDLGADVLAYARGADILVVANMGTKPIQRPEGKVLISSDPQPGHLLQPDSSVWIVNES